MNENKGWRGRLGLFLAVMGPGIVTAFADNDAGGIATYAAAGAKYGYALLFTMLISTICLVIAQEISARTGAVTGRGLSDLIRELFGVKWTFFAMSVLLVANIGTTASEFSGIATSFEIFGVTKYISVPIMAAVVWWLVLRGSYERTEKVFFVLCATFLSYIVSGMITNPPWVTVLAASVTPFFSRDTDFLIMAIGVIGTTITPWGQFYVQASVVDKGITAKDYKYTFWDVMIGSFFTWLIAFFIIVATAATLYVNHISIETAKDAALALEPLAGKYAGMLFGFGLLGASMLAAFILPLSTAYAICEAFGFEHGVSKTYKDAPVFFGLYTVLIVLGAGLVLWPGLSLYHVMLTSQVVNGILLPPILIFMVLIASNRNVMGRYANSRGYNVIAWIFTVLLIALTLLLLVTTLLPGFLDMALKWLGM
ncbi:natural resistance-associated macrophage protein [Lucifera butyrica]|uniref:Natural resistance-associated macrophage protein n=1 Tax=Lucifera butyrica TaxID=1351585 RepID=A0A498R2H1_9FIRM|nr:Nramp family divalent metal transporter [Lucifera butyrica]VBB05345.1 natural resistance-associated macrophage protein [Lucifera butyrica]